MPNTVRENIFANLKTTLETIVAGATYDNTVAEVRRYNINDQALGSYPLIVITPGTETGNDEAFPLLKCVLEVILEVWISPAEDETTATDTLLNSLLGDIKRSLMQDITRGGYAVDTTVGTLVEPFESLRGQAEAGYFITVKIEYRHDQTNPKTVR